MSLTLFHAARWIVIAAGAIAYPVLRITGGHFGGHHFAVLGVGVSLALLPGHPAVADLAFAQATGHVAPVCGRGRVLWGSGACWKRNFSVVYFLQHAGTYAMLAAVFRRHPRTRAASAVHPVCRSDPWQLAADEIRYSRQVTLAWTLLLLAISLVSASCSFLPASRSGRFSPISITFLWSC